MSRHTVDIRIRDHRFDVDAHYRVDSVYQRDCVASAFLCGAAWRQDRCDIWSEFYDDGNIRNLFYPLGHHAGIFWHLAHGRSHSAFAHSVRAAEVKFKSVTASVL